MVDKFSIPIEDVERLAKIFKDNNLQELSIEKEGFYIKLSKSSKVFTSGAVLGPSLGVQVPQSTSQSLSPQLTKVSSNKQEKERKVNEFSDDTKYHKVISPINGTFYRSPSPGVDPFVKEGDHVNSGQTLCIVEAMKVMNEIKSPVSGKIVKILKNNAEVVKSGDVIIIIEIG